MQHVPHYYNIKMKNKISIIIILLMLSSCNIIRLHKEFLSENHNYQADNIFVSIGWGGNSGIIELSNLVIIIDTKMNSKAKKYYNSIKDKLSDKTIYIVNTHVHYDHTDGNYRYNADTIFIPNYSDELWNESNRPENAIEKLPYVKVTEVIEIKQDGYTIKIIPTGQGHSYNDIVVLIENEKILFASDLFFNGYHPVIDKKIGANTKKWVEAIEKVCDEYEFETVVSGHGQVSDKEGFLRQAEYFNDIENAKNEPDKLKQVRKKYHKLLNMPNLTSFQKTVKYNNK